MAMPSCKELLKEIKRAHTGHFDAKGSSDYFVPQRNIYPHLHVTDKFCVYSTSASSHKDLIQGSKTYDSNLKSLVPPTTDNYSHLRAILDWMK